MAVVKRADGPSIVAPASAGIEAAVLEVAAVVDCPNPERAGRIQAVHTWLHSPWSSCREN